MAGGVYRAVIRLGANSGLPADESQNALHFQRTTDPVSGDYDSLNAAISAFFNTTASGATNKIGAYISGSMDRGSNKCTTDIYKLGATSPFVSGPPVATRHFSLPAAYTGAKPLPQELAACVSFHGDYTGIAEHGAGGTRPRARRRGRMYVGPLNDIALQESSSGVGAQTISSLVITDLAAAAAALKSTTSGLGWVWGVFSRVDALDYPITAGYVDDAWDVQRRRGQETTGRVSFS